MNSTINSKPTVLVVGATGMLGGKIIDTLLAQGRADVKALLRPGKPQAAEALKTKGAIPVEGDLFDPATLPQVCEGVDVIIASVTLGEERVNIEGQENLITAAEQAGVQRFFPLDYSADYFQLDDGDNFNLDMHKRVAEVLQNSRLKPTHVLNGMFTEFLFPEPSDSFGLYYDPQAATFGYWGDGEQLCDFTTTDDTAAYIAAAALDPEMADRQLKVAGDVLSMKGVIAAYEQATGQKVTGRSLGSVEELQALIAEKQRTAKSHWDYVGLQYHWAMVSGKGKLNPLDNNRYPDIQPVTVEQYLRRTQTQEVPT